MIVTASTEKGALAFVVSDPPTPADLERWAGLAALIVDATWTGAPGDTSRPLEHARPAI